MFQCAQKVLVQRTKLLEDAGPYKYAVELDELAWPGQQLFGSANMASKVVSLVQHAFAVLLFDMRDSPGHVNRLRSRSACVVERADHRGAGLFCTFDERVEPAGTDDHVVVHENDVLRRDVANPQVAGPIRGEVMLGADEAKRSLPRLCFEIAPKSWRRGAVDVDQLERWRSVLEDAFQRSAREAEPLPRHDHDRCLRTDHSSSPSCRGN